jgi:hypothetical protein
MITNEEVAASLLRKLARAVGHEPELADVQLVQCEDQENTMVYCDLADGSCVPMLIRTPPFLDASEVATLMLTGLAHLTVH